MRRLRKRRRAQAQRTDHLGSLPLQRPLRLRSLRHSAAAVLSALLSRAENSAHIVQVEHEQLLLIAPRRESSGVRVLVDHCGRPTVKAGLEQPGFKALLDLGASGRAFIKLSGFAKFSRAPSPHRGAWPFVEALASPLARYRWLSPPPGAGRPGGGAGTRPRTCWRAR